MSEGRGLRVDVRLATDVFVAPGDFVTSRVRVEEGLLPNMGFDGCDVGVGRGEPVEDRDQLAVRDAVVVGADVIDATSVGAGVVVGCDDMVGSSVGAGEVVACGETVCVVVGCGVSVACGETVCVVVGGAEADVDGDPVELAVTAGDAVAVAEAVLLLVPHAESVGRADIEGLRSGIDAAGLRDAEGLRVLVGDGGLLRLGPELCVEEREAAGAAVPAALRLADAELVELRDPVCDPVIVTDAVADSDARLDPETAAVSDGAAVSVGSAVDMGVAVVDWEGLAVAVGDRVLLTVVLGLLEKRALREDVGVMVGLRVVAADRDCDGEPVLDRLAAGLPDGVRVAEALRVTEELAVPVRVIAAEGEPVRLAIAVRVSNGEDVVVRLIVAVRVAVSVPTEEAESLGDRDADIVDVAVRVGVGDLVDVRDSRGDFVALGDFVDDTENAAVRVPVGVLVEVIEEKADRVPVAVRVEVTEGATLRVRVGVRVVVRDGSAVVEGAIAPPARARSQMRVGTSYSWNGCGATEPRIHPLSPGENPAKHARSSNSFILMRSRKPFLGVGSLLQFVSDPERPVRTEGQDEGPYKQHPK